MANDIIEANAVAAVKQITRLSNSLKPEILEGDTYPSWDGEIIVYSLMKEFEERNKGKILGRIPVQVKGTKVDGFSDKICKFDVETTDLRNYLNDGGALFFVVEMTNILDSNATKIFYSEFLSIDIRDVLNGKESQKTIRHTFKELPIDRLYSICKHFLLHREKQGYGVRRLDDEIQYDKYYFTTIGTTKADLDFYLFNSGTYIYGVDEKNNVEVPLHRFIADIKIEQDIFKIGIKNKVYYNKIYREITHKGRRTKFGKSFSIELLGNDTLNIYFKEAGNLRDRIKDCKFFIEVINANSIVLNETEVPINIDENEKNKILDGLPIYIGELEDILEMFRRLGIEPREDFDELKKYEKQLIILKDIILESDTNKHKITDKNFQEFHIGKYNIVLARGSGKYENRLFNFFNYDELKEKLKIAISFDENFENHVEHSPYIAFKPSHLYNYNNLNVDSVEKSLTNIKYNTQISMMATNDFLLNTLRFYDSQSTDASKDILGMVINVYDYILNFNNDVIYFINKMQAIRRKRELTDKEVSEIIEYKNSIDNNTSLMCAFHILLENYKEFEYTFGKLTEEEKKEISEYPIYNLTKGNQISQ